MTISPKLHRAIFVVFLLATLIPYVSASMALVAGIVLALALDNPWREQTAKLAPKLLAYSIVGLGAGMNLVVVARVGVRGLGYTAIGIGATMTLGWLLGRTLKVERDASILVSVGTAICGGSAIAAASVAIHAKSSDVTVAMVTVFLLNALAIIIFPPIGHYLQLDQTQFGLWSALAIHDTSSVVGAAMQYGAEALKIGTTVKLARALWIIPVSLMLGWWSARRHEATGAGTPAPKPKRPYFIAGFLATAALVTWMPQLQGAGQLIADLARRLLVVTLFLIGSNMTRERLRQVGIMPLLQGIILWLAMGTTTLWGIFSGWIRL